MKIYLCVRVVRVCFSHSVVSDSLWPHGLQPARLLCLWHSPGKKTGVGYHSLLQEIFPTQESDLDPLNYRQILYCLSHQGRPLGRLGTPPPQHAIFSSIVLLRSSFWST